MHFYLFALSIRTSEQIVYLFSGKPSLLVHGRFLHFFNIMSDNNKRRIVQLPNYLYQAFETRKSIQILT